jgi:ABC-type sulfate/molybdate transport systems ATPase subunit
VQFWDNPTRGLDSKTAVEFARLLRREADENSKTMVATMYQAGNAIYDEFDKVLVLADGLVTYYGPRSEARAYFEELGFVCPKGANIADFLTSVTVLTERIVAPGMEEKVPSTPEEFAAQYRESSIYRDSIDSIVPPEKLVSEDEGLAVAVTQEKRKHHIPRTQSVYTTGLWNQVIACTIRYVVDATDGFELIIAGNSKSCSATSCPSQSRLHPQSFKPWFAGVCSITSNSTAHPYFSAPAPCSSRSCITSSSR